MHYSRSAPKARRGITVLSLLLLIIGLVIVAIFLVRYLRSRPAVSAVPSHVILSEAKDLLCVRPKLAGQILRFAQDEVSILN
jgi:hypothetical protein